MLYSNHLKFEEETNRKWKGKLGSGLSQYIGYLSELNSNLAKFQFANKSFFSCQIVLKFSTKYGSISLQYHREMGVTKELNFARVWLKMTSWWRHQMETSSALLALCEGNSPVDSHHKGQWRGALMFSFICAWPNGETRHRWFETQSHSLWRHCKFWEGSFSIHYSNTMVDNWETSFHMHFGERLCLLLKFHWWFYW